MQPAILQRRASNEVVVGEIRTAIFLVNHSGEKINVCE